MSNDYLSAQEVLADVDMVKSWFRWDGEHLYYLRDMTYRAAGDRADNYIQRGNATFILPDGYSIGTTLSIPAVVYVLTSGNPLADGTYITYGKRANGEWDGDVSKLRVVSEI